MDISNETVTMDDKGAMLVGEALGWEPLDDGYDFVYFRVYGAGGPLWDVSTSEILSAIDFPLEDAPKALAMGLLPGNPYYSSPGPLTNAEATLRFEQVYVPIIELRMKHGLL